MTAIERTAYPRFKRRPSAQELADIYTLTSDDLDFARATARGPAPTLTLVVLLKSFQRLGYFPRLQDVPFAVISHVRSCLRLAPATALDATPRTLYRHHQAIRTYFEVRAWGADGRHVAVAAVYQAAQVMDHPADLIHVAIEELVRQRFELAGFSTLDRLASRVRVLVHRRLFQSVVGRLSDEDRGRLDRMLEIDASRRSAFNDLKLAPKRPSLSHLDALVRRVCSANEWRAFRRGPRRHWRASASGSCRRPRR